MEKKEELKTRREFFKKTAEDTLPFLGILMFGSSFLQACDPIDIPSGCGKSCSGSCESDCSGECSGGCKEACVHVCTRWLD